MIDVHGHLYDERYNNDITDILHLAKENNVEKMICASSSINSSKKALALANKYENIYCTIGVHPDDANTFDDTAEKFLLENGTNPKVVAIGEIGLDFHTPPFDEQKQKEVFIKQLEIAHKLHLPVQIHSRDATGETLELLRQHKNLLTDGGIIHCFSGSIESFWEYQKLGFSVSLGGVITFKNAKNALEVAKQIPLEFITIETDCPYLTPHPHRGELNHPAFTSITATKLAETKGISYGDVEKQTTQNALKLFPKLKN